MSDRDFGMLIAIAEINFATGKSPYFKIFYYTTKRYQNDKVPITFNRKGNTRVNQLQQ